MAKLMLRPLYGSDYPGGWDDPLPSEQALRWQAFLTVALKTGELRVPRSVVMEGCSELQLIGFWDGSLDAHASCLYLRAEGRDAWGQDCVRVNLVYAKSRVAPLGGTTISKMELQGMVNVTRAALKFVEAVDQHISRVVIAGDSMCALMSVRRDGTAYIPYFQHRVAEILRNLRDLDKRVGLLEPTLKISGEQNPADICTRGKATMADVEAGSTWQSGPSFLRLPRDQWPLSTPDDPSAVPASVLRKSATVALAALAPGDSRLEMILVELLTRAKKLDEVLNVLARVLRVLGNMGQPKEHREVTPLPVDRDAAWKLLLYWEQRGARRAFREKRLDSLSVTVIEKEPKSCRGLLVTRGRIPEQEWEALVGTKFLPVLTPDSVLARLIVLKVHEEDHRKDVGHVLAGTRRYAWITGARRLIKRLVHNCMRCRVRSTRRCEQIMGELEPQAIQQSRPFQYVTLDLLGPLLVKGLGTERRRHFKVWAAVLVCNATRAVSIWAMEDYSTDGFLGAFSSHCAIYGAPSLVTSDQGTQLRGAAGVMPNWEMVQHKTASSGTTWRFIPAQAPWRVGLAERMVGLLKSSLKFQINEGDMLNYAQLSALLLRVADTLNRRPLSARSFGVSDFMAITPRDLLLGAAPSSSPEEVIVELEEDITVERLAKRMQLTEKKIELWSSRFFKDVLPLLVPRRKWMTAFRNLSVGDIVLLGYESKYAKDRYRLARVLKVHPDKCGGVRTVTVGLRNRARAIGEQLEVCRAGLQEMIVPVQRLVLILPYSEQQALEPDLHQCARETEGVVEQELGEGSEAEQAEPLPPRVLRRRGVKEGLIVRVPDPEGEILDL